MLRFYLFLIILGFSSICIVNTAKILAVFPVPSISNQVVFRPLMHELAKRGHEVVVITTDPAFPKDAAQANLTEIDIHEVSYNMWRELFLNKKRGTASDIFSQFKDLVDISSIVFNKQLESDEVQKLLRDKTKTFDLLFIDACHRQALSFSHFYKAPVILISSMGIVFGNEEIIGVPEHPILYPTLLRQRIYNLTIWEKIRELYMHYLMISYSSYHEEEENKILRRHFGADFPPLSELKNNVDMLFLNVNPLWQSNQPVPPSVIYMGGIHIKPKKELPQDLQYFLDSSKNGVIYVSFGTNVQPSLLPPEKIRILVSVLSQLPYDVLWKWDKDELPGRGKNIKISKWLPQSDLLRHPKIKLFITQCGLQSTDEAIAAGVPLIGMPMIADQWYNAEKYEKLQIGIKLLMESTTEDSFMGAIKTIINDERLGSLKLVLKYATNRSAIPTPVFAEVAAKHISYRQNIVKLRELIKDQLQTPLERAVWWTEHVLRHGNARHLRSPAANISWTEYLELKLVSTLLLTFLILLVILVKAVSLLINYVNNKFLGKVKKL